MRADARPALPFHFLARETQAPTPGERALARARSVVCLAFAAFLAAVAIAPTLAIAGLIARRCAGPREACTLAA